MKSARSTSPEFSEDQERVSHMRRRLTKRLPRQDAAQQRHLQDVELAGSDAAWRAYPKHADNPYPAETAEHEAWRFGARSSYEWAKVHEEEDWHRVVDGREVRP